MRRLILFILALVVPCSAAWAQREPKVAIFGGYSYVTTGLLDTPNLRPGFRSNLNGWNGQVAWNASHNIGFIADFGGYYGSPDLLVAPGKVKTSIHSFLFGPKLTHHTNSFEMFVHALLGVSRASLRLPPTSGSPGTPSQMEDTQFAVAFGAGLDYGNRGSHVTFRVAQADAITSLLFHSIQNHIRLSTGIVLRW